MPLLYTVAYAIGFLVLSPLFLYKMWKRGKYRQNFFQRFGLYAAPLREQLTATGQRCCWIQAVSVGEVNVALVLIAALRQAWPQWRLVLSTTTSTGYALARARLPAEVVLVYFPQDFPPCVRRAYDLIHPDVMVLMESEVWPNHVWEAARRQVPVVLVNARLSSRSARRYGWVGGLFRRVFGQLALACAQSAEDAEHLVTLGVPPERVHVTGNMKYDAALPQAAVGDHLDPALLIEQLGVAAPRPVLVAGSTHPGEETILFDLLARLRERCPDLFLILVPRHVERTAEVAELARRKQIRLVRRTELSAAGPAAKSPDCLLVDTTGELRWFYEVATVIFVGKSLVGHGGQNIVEAAMSGHPVVVGPHLENFRAIARDFVSAGACVQVADAAGLQQALAELLADAPRRERIAAAARRVIEANVGATHRSLALLGPVIHRLETGPKP